MEMASSENLASLDAWAFRPAFGDSTWLSEAYARETETLTKALHKSLSDRSDTFSPFLTSEPPTTQTSSVSGSDVEVAAVPPRRRNAIPVATASGKACKRKSRASKRATTTFITADPANFRQMVQQVTGVRFGSAQLPVAPVLKPEPQRLVNRLQGCLPTLDTSAFLLDHHHHQLLGPTPAVVVQPSFSAPPPDVAVGGGAGVGLDFDSFSSFPTLESWKVM